MTQGPRDWSRESYAAIRKCALCRVVYDRMKFMSQYAAGRSVLDIGCVEHSMDNADKYDWLHKHLVAVAREVVGLDYEEAQVQRMRDKGYNVVTGDATNFNLNRAFDVIMAGETLEHLLNAEAFLKSARMHMHSGSLLILSVPNANSVNYFMQNLIYGYEVDGYDHVAFYTPLTIYNLLRKCGFRLKTLAYVQADTWEHHEKLSVRLVVTLFRYIQLAVTFIRPNLARQIVVVAEPVSTSALPDK